MLDDLKYIHQRDAQDALGVAEKQWQQYQHDYNFSWNAPRPIHQVVIAGMGGSGLAAKTAKVWPGLSVPFEVVQDYVLPEYVDQNTLVICCSYSGNTEETLSALAHATNKDLPIGLQPMVVVVASGGELIKTAQEEKLPYIELPSGFQPRVTLGYQLRALLEIFRESRLCEGALEQLQSAADWLREETKSWTATVPAKDNLAKQLAQECMGKSPVIYAGPNLFPAAYKWKISFNENAKNVAWCSQIPEFNHNEFVGWSSHPVDKPYTVIDLRSKLEHPQVQKRFVVSERLLSGKRPAPEIVEVRGESLAQQMLWTVALGDFVTIYVALLNGINPTPVDLVEKLKIELK